MRTIDADALQKQLSRKKAEVCNARYTEGFNDALLRFKSMIHAAPTVQPQRMRGHWRKTLMACYGGGTLTEYECSECKEHAIIVSNYCPNCGAKMEETE